MTVTTDKGGTLTEPDTSSPVPVPHSVTGFEHLTTLQIVLTVIGPGNHPPQIWVELGRRIERQAIADETRDADQPLVEEQA
jgi:hypothetical protein